MRRHRAGPNGEGGAGHGPKPSLRGKGNGPKGGAGSRKFDLFFFEYDAASHRRFDADHRAFGGNRPRR
ncbi:hypothetical protein U716_10635 [Rhodobacter capsulatus B6]|nr:hypothetical protein U716_10635 [Rhodobacter capsulatus B6]